MPGGISLELKAQVEIKGRLLKALIARPDEIGRKAVWAGMVRLVEAVEAKAKEEVPVATSNLLRSITSTVSPDGTRGEIRATAPYAKFVHEGTGLYGPFKRLIRPTTKKALFWPGAAHPVKSVKGMKPNPFFARALRRVDAQKEFSAGTMNYLQTLTG